LAALISQSCLSWPSSLAMNSGANGITWRTSGRTMVACKLFRARNSLHYSASLTIAE